MIWYRANKGKGVVAVLAHGAGAGQKHAWIVTRATAWSDAGIDVATFDFPYMEAGRKAPDRAAVLEAAWRKAIQEAGGSVIACGKSMGGRIATMVAAQGEPGILGLVTLGYPLHPPGQPDKLRVAHLGKITQPWLAVQGAKDTFGGGGELKAWLPKQAKLVEVEGGDHSLKQPKKAKVQVNIDAVVVGWMLDL